MFNSDFVDAVRSITAHCNVCPNSRNGKALPFVGAEPLAILFGEAPGKEEARTGTPFIGKSGQYMWSTFSKLGVDRDNFLIVNTIQCRPVIKKGKTLRNGKPTPKDTKRCNPIVQALLFGSGLTEVMCLGSYPKDWIANYLEDKDLLNAPIGMVVGKTIKVPVRDPVNNVCRGTTIYVTFNYHPAATIYDTNKKELFEKTVKLFVDRLGV